MTTLAVVGDLGPSNSNVLDFVRRLHAMHGAPTAASIEQKIRTNVAAELGGFPNLPYYQSQAVNGWKNFRRTPTEAVRIAVTCARAAITAPPVLA